MDPDSSVSRASSASDTALPDAGRALTDAAKQVLSRRFRVVLLVRNAYERMTAHSDALSAVWNDLRTMLRLLLRWVTRSYQRISWPPLVSIAAALLYFVTPVDIVPDTLGAFGFVDDVAVINTAVETLRSELQRFRAWERAQPLPD